jgi:N-acetylneuraminic acid mutarotase
MKKIITLLSFSVLAVFCFAQGTWTQRQACTGSARYRAVAFEVNGKCYMGTGSTGGGISQNLQDIWEYDVAMNTWSQKADLPGPKRTNATAASINNFGYLGLGSNNNTLLNDWYQYDPVGNTWTQKTNFTGVKRFGAVGFGLEGMIFVGGGLDSAQTTALSDFYAYDPVGDAWVSKSHMIIGVSSPACFILGSKAYVVSGALNGSTVATTQNAEYDPILDTWTSRAAYPPGNTFSAVGFAVSGYGYVGTGFTGNLTDVVYRYNQVSDNWTQETSWPTGIRQWAVSAVSGNKAFVGTGNSTGGNLYSDWWEFTPAVSTSASQIDNKISPVYFDNVEKEIVINNNGATELKIFSVEGKLMLQQNLPDQKSRISWNHKGVFLISLNGDDAVKVFCQ